MSAASHKNLHWKILAALILGLGVGFIINKTAGGAEELTGWANAVVETSRFVGKIFIQGLKMIVIPLIVSSIILAIMNIGGDRDFGRLGVKTIVFYLASGLVAVVIGLGVVNLMQPGNVDEAVRAEMLANSGDSDSFMSKAEGRSTGDIVGIFLRMVPTNVVAAASKNEFLALIFFSLIFGYAAGKLPEKLRETQEQFWEGINKAVTMITNGVIWFAPVGVFGLVVPTIATTGADLLGNMLKFALTVFLALGIHAFVVMPLVMMLMAKENPIKHFKAMLPALLTAFSTASSSSTLPLTTERVQKGAGVSTRVSGFTLPLGATVNMDGTALFECVVVIFLAQLFGVEMTLLAQFNVVLLALLTSVGVAGIPSASLVAIVLILTNVGFSQEMIAQGIGIVFVVDRILDMLRTAVNVFGDSCAAVVIGKSEGETGYYPETKA